MQFQGKLILILGFNMSEDLWWVEHIDIGVLILIVLTLQVNWAYVQVNLSCFTHWVPHFKKVLEGVHVVWIVYFGLICEVVWKICGAQLWINQVLGTILAMNDRKIEVNFCKIFIHEKFIFPDVILKTCEILAALVLNWVFTNQSKVLWWNLMLLILGRHLLALLRVELIVMIKTAI